MWGKLRYLYASVRHTYDYANAINDHFLDYYIRHHKVIGWHKGLPVYSSFVTPGLSKAQAHLLSRRLVSSMIEKPLPAIAHVGVTDICNARCEHCSFYNAMDKPGERVLGTDEMKQVLDACQRFGVSVLHIVGGEPLLRKDLPELIASVDKNKSTCSVFTNGWFLKEQAASLKRAGTMMVMVSLDSTDPARHDAFRKKDGMFARAVAGIKEAQRQGLLTGISTTLVQEDLENGNFERMILLARDLRVNELIVFDTMPVGMYSHRVDLERNKINRTMLFSVVDKYNALTGFPGIFCYAHVRDQATFGCSAGRNFFYVTPYGEVCPCDFNAAPAGNLLEESLPTIWFRLVAQRHAKGNDYFNSCCSRPSGPEIEIEQLKQPLLTIGAARRR